jgi:hypothetical protein
VIATPGLRARLRQMIEVWKRRRGLPRMHRPLHPQCHFTRRTFVRLMAAGGLLTRSDSLSVPARAQTVAAAYSYPMGFPGRPLGDGLLVRHGYATENTWYNPG